MSLRSIVPLLVFMSINPLAASASERACLLEGSFKMMGKTIPIKDCMQNLGLPQQQQFVQNCQGTSQAAVAFGAAPAKITYMAACPTPAQGSCERLFGSALSTFYYQRDAQSMADTETSCKAGGGIWKKG